MTDVAVLHGRYHIRGGGERVACEIARLFDAPIYSAFVDDELVPDDVETREIAVPKSVRGVGIVVSNTPLGGQSVYDSLVYNHVPELAEYDIVINTHRSSAWYIPTDSQRLYRYIHSPERWAFDKWQERDPTILRNAYALATRAMIQQYVSYPHRYLCNSETIAERTNTYLGVPESDIRVVYPPVETDGYPSVPSEPDLYVTVGRLTSHKRVHLLVEAFRERDERLVIAGRGQEYDALQESAPPNVDLLGYVSEERKRELLSRARAFLFVAKDEDFGIAPVEAFAAGTPVIGVEEGFTKHQIQPGKNGLFTAPSSEAINQTIDQFQSAGVAWSDSEIRQYAQQFSRDRFRQKMQEYIIDTQTAETETELEVPQTA